MEADNNQTDNQQTQTRPRERVFIPGDEWLYHKFYTGLRFGRDPFGLVTESGQYVPG